ncbi:MAG: DUF2271 domain-containing protein [Pseudomonadota bacterium]
MRKSQTLALTAFAIAAAPASADTGTITYEIPRLDVSGYRKPYVAVWIEDADRKPVKMVAVLFDQSPIGDKWLPDLKTWWRRGGRAMDMPVSGVTRPTRGPGQYKLNAGSMSDLPPGSYALVIEAAREKGGREILKAPFDWKPGEKVSVSAQGSSELGAVTLTISE